MYICIWYDCTVLLYCIYIYYCILLLYCVYYCMVLLYCVYYCIVLLYCIYHCIVLLYCVCIGAGGWPKVYCREQWKRQHILSNNLTDLFVRGRLLSMSCGELGRCRPNPCLHLRERCDAVFFVAVHILFFNSLCILRCGNMS